MSEGGFNPIGYFGYVGYVGYVDCIGCVGCVGCVGYGCFGYVGYVGYVQVSEEGLHLMAGVYKCVAKVSLSGPNQRCDDGAPTRSRHSSAPVLPQIAGRFVFRYIRYIRYISYSRYIFPDRRDVRFRLFGDGVRPDG